MSSDLATELSALRTLITTAKDDSTHTREAYSHDDLVIVLGSAQTSREMDKDLARSLCSEHSVLGTLLSSCRLQLRSSIAKKPSKDTFRRFFWSIGVATHQPKAN